MTQRTQPAEVKALMDTENTASRGKGTHRYREHSRRKDTHGQRTQPVEARQLTDTENIANRGKGTHRHREHSQQA